MTCTSRAAIAAGPEDTVLTDAYAINWPRDSPVRVLRNAITDALGYGLLGHDPDDIPREQIGEEEGRPIYLMSTDSPLRSMTGELDRMALFAGQSCGLIDRIVPAGEVVAAMIREAGATLAGLGSAAACRERRDPQHAVPIRSSARSRGSM